MVWRKKLVDVLAVLGAMSVSATAAHAEIITYEVSGSLLGANDVRPFYLFADLPLVFPFAARIQVDTRAVPILEWILPSGQSLFYVGTATSAELTMGDYSFETDRRPWLNESIAKVRYEAPGFGDRYNAFSLSVFDNTAENASIPGAPATPLYTPIDIDISGLLPQLDEAGLRTFRIRIKEVGLRMAGADLLSSAAIPGTEVSGSYQLPDSQFNAKASLWLVRDGTGEEILANDAAVFIASEFNVTVISAVPEPSETWLVLTGIAVTAICVRRRSGPGRRQI